MKQVDRYYHYSPLTKQWREITHIAYDTMIVRFHHTPELYEGHRIAKVIPTEACGIAA